MPDRSSKRPSDANRIAKLIADLSVGEAAEILESGRNPAAVALGRLGGKKGGRARAKRLSAARRSEIARAAAEARWKHHDS